MFRQLAILYIKPNTSSFIESDEKILSKYFVLKSFLITQNSNKLNYLFRLFHLFFYLLFNLSGKKLLVCWFGDYHAALMVFIGRIFNRKTVIFIGGMEAICYKELGKGVYLKRIRGSCVRYALRNASLVIPNHNSLLYHENYYYNPDHPHIDGIKHYVKNLHCKIEIIPNGVDPTRIMRNYEMKKQSNLVLTLGSMRTLSDFYNKGFDLFIEVARRNPEIEFVLINIHPKYLSWVETTYQTNAIHNLKIFSGFCPNDTLVEYFNRAKVYVQASITEGMPVSLSEAMLCECVPVGSNVNGIPDAIGDYGVIIDSRSPDKLGKAIKLALSMETGPLARYYTIDNYSFEIREKKIKEVFSILFES